MKTNKIMMAVVAVFISMAVMNAAVPSKKAAKAEPVKKECCDKAKTTECKDAKTAECKHDKAASGECKHDKAAGECKHDKVAGECKNDKAAGECKDKNNQIGQKKSDCCNSPKK